MTSQGYFHHGGIDTAFEMNFFPEVQLFRKEGMTFCYHSITLVDERIIGIFQV